MKDKEGYKYCMLLECFVVFSFVFPPSWVAQAHLESLAVFYILPNHVRHILVVGRHGHRELHPQKVSPTNYDAAHCFYGHQRPQKTDSR